MSDSFKDREKGYEAKYKMDEELRFRAQARRNRLLGEWLADKFGMTSDERTAYAKEVVAADLDEPGIEDVVRKVMQDIAARGVDVSEQEVRDQIVRFEAVAIEQLAEQYPGALGPDHSKIGD